MGQSPFSPAPCWSDSRMAECGFVGGLSESSCGDMKNPDNRAHFFAAAGFSPAQERVLHQRHGTVILRAGISRPAPVPEGDGWVCSEKNLVACVFTADCLPIFIWDKGGRAFGVFHAGWRGLAAGLPRLAALRMKADFGVSENDWAAAIGPHAGACCYQVGPEMRANFPSESFRESGSVLYFDLALEARNQLIAGGVPPGEIKESRECTVCSGNYFSHRKKDAGRMAAFMAFAGKPR